MRRIKTVLWLVILMLGGLFLSLQVGVREATVAAQSVHKVIASPGALDGRSGITRWHDYGTFALYKVTDAALAGLPAGSYRLADEMDRLLFTAYPFDTQQDSLDLPDGLMTAVPATPSLHLIQFVGPIKDEWLARVAATGAVPIHYVANNGYLVWTDGNGRAQLQRLVDAGDFLQYSAPYQPYFKLGTAVASHNLTSDSETTIPVVIQMLRHPGQQETEALLKKWLTAVDSGWEVVGDFQNITGQVRLADIPAIAARPDVFWIEQHFERELLDEVQGQVLAGSLTLDQTGPSGPGYLAWLDSLGFSQNPADYPLVDITDDGIGNGTTDSGDPTLHEQGDAGNPSRLAYVENCTSAADGGSLDGHGHINVSIAGGYDMRSGAPYQDADGFQRGLGINPYGRFAGTRVFTDNFDLSACGNSDQGLIQQTQNNGAVISSNSWGCASCATSYDTSSQAYDFGVRDADPDEPGNQPVAFIFSAGNSGPSAGTIGSPGNGKNMITVGASESVRPTWIDGCNVSPTGADNIMDVAYFSSRGPAPGSRTKPELIAPGTHIQGTASTNDAYNGSGVCDQFLPSGQTVFAASSGTSHSTPAVAGAASLYYYWLENVYGLLSPSPAMLKAYLMAHPVYLTGAYANDSLPSPSQGYGMPDMSLAFDDAARVLVDETAVLTQTGTSWTYTGAVVDSTRPLRIAMAYTDEPGLVGTSPQVNDLNLAVEWAGEIYWGNEFSGAWSIPGGTPDAANNYEAVFLPVGSTGNFTITVTGFNIAGDGLPNNGDITDQDFALVCYNCGAEPGFSLQAAPVEQTVCAPDEVVVAVTVGSLLGFSDPVTLAATGVFTSAFSVNPVVPSAQSELVLGNTAAAAPGAYVVGITAVAPTRTESVTVGVSLYDAVPTDVVLTTPGDGETAVDLTPTLVWQSANQAASYVVEIAKDAGFITDVLTGTVAGTEFTVPTALEPLATYYWRVRADNVCGTGYSPTYTFTTELKLCAGASLPVPDGLADGVVSQVVFEETAVIRDIDVWIDMTHTWVGDLIFSLEHLESGTQVILIDRPGFPATSFGCSYNNIDAVLDDDAATFVEDACSTIEPALAGTLRPMEPLAAFNGQIGTGTWQLSVVDTTDSDSGTLNAWCLLPSYGLLETKVFLPIGVR